MTRLLLEHYGSVDFINQKYLLGKNNRIPDAQAATQLTEDVTRLVSHAQDKRAYMYWGSYDSGVGQRNAGMVCAIIDENSNRQLGNLALIVRPAYFSTIFNDVAMGSGTQIYILDASNEVIIRAADASNDIGAFPEPGLLENLARNAASGEARSSVTVEGKRGERYLTAYAEIPGTTRFVVSTTTEKKPTVEAQAVRSQIVLVGISGVLLSTLLTYLISHSISAPFREPVRKVHDIGDNAGAQVDEEKHMEARACAQDELSRLAQRFGRMHEAIKQKTQKINEINTSLEQTVIERTAELVTRERGSHTLIENSPGTITHYDRESRRIHANPASCVPAGCSFMEALGKWPSEFPGGDSVCVCEKIISDIISSGISARFELRQAGKDGWE